MNHNPKTLKRISLPVLIIVLSLAVGILSWSNVSWSVRPILMAGFVVFCPGLAIIELVPKIDLLTELVLSITLSLVLGTVIALILLLTHHWSPPIELATLIALSLIGAGFKISSALRIRIVERSTT